MSSDSPRTNWGRWGDDDERGALNLVTPDVVLEASRIVRTGKVYALGLPISRTRTPAVFDRPAPERLTRNSPRDAPPQAEGADPRVGSGEDLLIIPTHSGTHIDALSHIFEGDSYYNGHRVESFTTSRGASKCSIVNTGSFATRGVLLDVAGGVAGDGRALPPGHLVTVDELEACCAVANLEVRSGDAVLIRTGWIEELRREPATPGYPQPGIGLDAARWLQERDVALVGADNSAVEVLPFDGDRFLGVHVELIAHSGVGLLEHLWLADLAADGCFESLLVVGALQIVGATGSPVNPIAIG